MKFVFRIRKVNFETFIQDQKGLFVYRKINADLHRRVLSDYDSVNFFRVLSQVQ